MNYIYCSGTTQQTVAVSISTVYTGCNTSTNNECTDTVCYVDLTFNLDKVLDTDLTVWYQANYYHEWDYVGGGGGNGSESSVETYSIVIPAGHISYVLNNVKCKDEERCQGADYDDSDLQTWSGWTVSTQQSIPNCFENCSIEITSYTINKPSQSGRNDGSIEIVITGNTGSTATYKINGEIDISGSTTLTGHTFTGLSGNQTYYVTAINDDNNCSDTIELYMQEGDFRSGDFIVFTPANLVASENPIILGLKTAIVSPNPVYASITFTINGTVLDDDSIKIELDYPKVFSATYYAKEFPDNDMYFLASTLTDEEGNEVGSNTNNEIAVSLGDVFQNDPTLSRYYYVKVSGTEITLTAKEYNENLTLNPNDNVTIDSSAITATFVRGITQYDGQIVSDYSLYTDIFVNTDEQYGETADSDNYNFITELELPYSIDNIHKFDLAPVVKNFVSTPKIDFSLTGATTIPNMIASFYAEYGEKYPLIPNYPTKKKRSKGTTDFIYVLNSALRWEDANDLTILLGNKLSDLNPNMGHCIKEGTAQGDKDLTFTNILIDSASTKTTNVAIRITEIQSSGDTGWVTPTGNTYTYTWNTPDWETDGYVYLSGKTNNVTEIYQWYYDWGCCVDCSETWTEIDVKPIYENLEFLTNSPEPKQVQRESNEFLYIILSKNYGRKLTVVGDMDFYDGTSLTGQTLVTLTEDGYNWGGVYIIPTGYENLNLDSYETYSGGTRKIRELTIAIKQTISGITIPLSEEKIYRFEIDEMPRKFGVAFQNKYGAYDVFDFIGEVIDDVDHQTESYEEPRDVNYNGSSPSGFIANGTYKTAVTRKHTVNSGWIDEDHFDWLMELLTSNRIYNYTRTDQPYLLVDNVDYKKSSNDDLYSITVTFKESLQENDVTI